MAPDVKQADGEDPNALLVRFGAHLVQVPNTRIGLATAYRCGEDAQSEQITELHRVIRKWEINFLLVCSQFLVVAVAAVWGWMR